ncbi:MAG: dipeptide epimerase [Methanomassiliicoccales archaeon]|jgi:L-alanine-DL-glutamate epimerase-like enolase superfamily enzyme|nr:dipeptide epimerase [Methanomassiliicoccales archaeon]
MKIESVDFMKIRLEREEPFRIATGVSKDTVNFLIIIHAGDIDGLGVAVPNSVTKETAESIENSILKVRGILIGCDAEDIDGIHNILDRKLPGYPAVESGVDLAIYDLIGKLKGFEVCDMLGRMRDCIETSFTIGIEDLETSVKKAANAVKSGFRVLKIKTGLDVNGDIRRVGAIRDVVGSGIRLRVDCNQGYSFEEAKRFVEELDCLDVEFVEQPVSASDFESMKKLSSISSIPIMADESAKTLDDVNRIIREDCASMINLKLVKFGGIHSAVIIDTLCKDHGIGIQVGCMSECAASIAGGLHFALSGKAVKYADLDSHFSFVNDPTNGVEFRDGRLYTSGSPGLGVNLIVSED